MKREGPEAFVIEQFATAFRLQVHLLLAAGIDVARSEIEQDSEEEAITGFIADAIHRYLIRQPVPWTKFYAVRNEHPIPNAARPGKKRKEIDLIIELAEGEGRPEYVFEAKQLNSAKPHQQAGNYTNTEAMGRFLAGEYAKYTARFPEVGMLGYVLSDTAATWHGRLKGAIVARSMELSLQLPQEEVSIVDVFPLEWTSVHDRTSATRPVTIYHILVPCINQNGSTPP